VDKPGTNDPGPAAPSDADSEVREITYAMDRAVATLHPDAGLVSAALVQGYRRRARARLAKLSGALCVVALVAGAAVLRSQDIAPAPVGPAGTSPPVPSSSPPPSPPLEFPSVPQPWTDTDAPAGGPERVPPVPGPVDDFRQQVAGALQDLLPPAVGAIALIEDDVSAYRAVTEAGTVFSVVFSVIPAPVDSGTGLCGPAGPGRCVDETLAGGEPVALRSYTGDAGTDTGVSASFRIGRSDVYLAVLAGAATRTSAPAPVPVPVTAADLLSLANDPRVVELLSYADANPVQGTA
jgi:hypothetical protein